jgi:UDP-glucose 4-epimerase
MRIAVTGANGFVGVHVTRQLLEKHDVLAIDSLRYGPWRFSQAELARFRSEAIDIRDRKAVERVLEEFAPEAIIHLAAIHFIPECERLPDEAVSINVEGTVNLLLACRPNCRFVFTSSAAVYAPNEAPHREADDATGPVDVYGFTKLHGEQFVEYFSRLKQLQSVIVRLFNVVGPGETNPHVLPEIIKQLKSGSRRLRLGNVQPRRDYIYVADVAAGFIAAATKPFPRVNDGAPVLVNLGSGASHSVEEIVQKLGRIIAEPVEIEVDPQRVRKVDRPNLVSDNSRMQALFSWAPAHDIDRSLQESWKNPDILW